MEESEHWGEMGNTKAAKKAKAMDLIKNHDMVGKHNWVEDKDWWKKHAPDMDVSNMSEEQASEYYKLKKKEERLKKRCERHPDDKCKDGGKVVTDLDSIREKLAHHYDEWHKDEQGPADPAAEAVVGETLPDGAGGVADVNDDEAGEVAEDEDKAGGPTEAVAEGTSPGGEDTEETSTPDGANGVADAAANEAGEVTKDTEAEQPDDDDDDDDEDDPVEGSIQNSIVNEYTVLEQVGHDSSSFV